MVLSREDSATGAGAHLGAPSVRIVQAKQHEGAENGASKVLDLPIGPIEGGHQIRRHHLRCYTLFLLTTSMGSQLRRYDTKWSVAGLARIS